MNRFDPGSFGIRQMDQTDCGVACVQSILSSLGYYPSLQSIRSLSGKSSTGTTLLGLQDCLAAFSVSATGYQATPDNLKSSPLAILHFIQEGLHHFVISYRYNGKYFEIFDPGLGAIKLSETELITFWKSGRMLLIEPVIRQKPQPESFNQNSLIQFLQQYPRLVLHSIITGILIASSSLAMASFIQQLLDKNSKAVSTPLTIALFLAAILGFKALTAFLRSTVLNAGTIRLQNDTFSQALSGIFTLPPAELERKTKGDLISVFHNSIRVYSNGIVLLGDMLLNVIIFCTTCGYFFYLTPTLGILLLAFGILLAILTRFLRNPHIFLQKMFVNTYCKNESAFHDILEGALTIRNAQKESLFTKMLQLNFNELQAINRKLAGFKTNSTSLLEFIYSFFILLIFYYLFHLAQSNSITIGEMMAGFFLALNIGPVSQQLLFASTQIHETKNLLQRFLTDPPAKSDPPGNIDPEQITEIEFKNLTFRYPGKMNCISNLNLVASSGDRILLKGPAGVGKTTLFKLLLQYYQPQEGNIFCNKVPTNDIQPDLLRKKISFVPQQPKLFNGTILFNITLNPDVPATEVESFFENSFLNPMRAALPGGLQTYVQEIEPRFAPEQHQLIGIMRALWNQPEVLILDDCTHSIAPERLHPLQQYLLLSRIIVFISTHTNDWDSTVSKIIYLKV